jgi:hypothetical protein
MFFNAKVICSPKIKYENRESSAENSVVISGSSDPILIECNHAFSKLNGELHYVAKLTNVTRIPLGVIRAVLSIKGNVDFGLRQQQVRRILFVCLFLFCVLNLFFSLWGKR